ncbi:putative MFS family arabinose efflux permease [Stackebrandtia endophytica]|uniref:Putative MFS family arabinose efflux permease n=1 Tax=Stackebrandtia endophytica TaxID=1496996 RepID=A0A543B0D7_9ACTN|nr:MFS transporter [Stackebrandtia endophytica]TQL78293.1 putative MFS family arabinose efflux permease [Stackebrandtia endophytica]
MTSQPTTRWGPVVALALAMVVNTSDMTIAAIVLPGIADDFGITPATSAWVLLAYSLPMAAIAIPAGRWVDRSDLRAVFVLSMVGVAAASIVAAVAPTFWVLLAARFFQGFVAALTMAAYMPIVVSSVRDEQRGRAIGYIVSIMTIGGMIGAPLGGLVAGGFGWPGVFLLKLPVVLAAVVVGLMTVPSNGKRLPTPDGTLLRDTIVVGGAITGLVLGMENLGSAPIVAAGLIAVAVILAIVWIRLATSKPIISVIASRVLGLNLLGLLLASLLIGLITFLLPYFVTEEMTASPEMLGVVLLAYSASVAPVSPVAGWLADRFGPHPVAVIGGVITAIGLATMLTLPSGATMPDLLWRIVVLGIGGAVFNGPINTALMAATPREMIGVAGGLFATVRTLASTIGPAAVALVWTFGGGGIGGFNAAVALLLGSYLLGLVLMVIGRPARATVAA